MRRVLGGAVLDEMGGFPRPSGRGSIAARLTTAPVTHCRCFPRPSGRGSIAAYLAADHPDKGIDLPPAIRPGLHCGKSRWNAIAAVARLPPAIRPGLHCGHSIVQDRFPGIPPSPGHQAGAPLRPLFGEAPLAHDLPSPGHQAGAPLRQLVLSEHNRLRLASSPGHQAGAPLRPAVGVMSCGSAALLPPAIRPGLHCGRGPVGLGITGGCRPSPGHQAGAPLRRSLVVRLASGVWFFPRPSGRGSIAACWSGCSRPGTRRLPPAIRPGLHCGDQIVNGDDDGEISFPRPSGRGSIAAIGCARPHHSATRTSPGHQAGAPLRRPGSRKVSNRSPGFPRPSGRGSIAATPPAGRSTSSGPLLPPAIRPGLHCGAVRSWRRGAVLRDLPPAIRPGLHCGAAPWDTSRGAGRLPPAIRPGLHCGPELEIPAKIDTDASPGHQAGAPLRLRAELGHRRQARRLPPAIRPGLHCGQRRGALLDLRLHLPPAIRPGLHCGAYSSSAEHRGRSSFPRPSGRGSIAACRT